MINSARRGHIHAAPCASGISVFGFWCVCLDVHYQPDPRRINSTAGSGFQSAIHFPVA